MAMITLGLMACLFSRQWEPKTDLLPANFVHAAQFLLDHGLADPRGCELRTAVYDINVPSESFAFRGANLAWVRPNDKQIITPYGITVPAKSIGPPGLYSQLLPRIQSGQNESFSNYLFLDDNTFLDLILLAIHGEEKLVAKYLDLISVNNRFDRDKVSFRALTGYKYALLSLSLSAFRQGNDDLALQYIKRTQQDLPEFELEVPKVWSKAEYAYSEEKRTDKSFFPFVREVPNFQQELEIRNHPSGIRHPSVDEISTKPVGEQAQLLIDLLPDIGNPNEKDNLYHVVESSKAYRKLVDLGQAAVPALISTLKSNQRYTRTLVPRFGGPLKQLLQFTTVNSVAREALAELAFLPTHSSTDNVVVSYWEQNLGKKDSTRAYEALLRSLGGDPMRDFSWQGASRALLTDENSYAKLFNITSVNGYGRIPFRKVSIRPEMRDVLKYSNPSVSELFVQGMRSKNTQVEAALEMAQTSFYWQPQQSLAALQAATRKYLDLVKKRGSSDDFYSEGLFGFVLDARKSIGDKTCAGDQSEYASILYSRSKSPNDQAGAYFLNRLDDDKVRALAMRQFFDPGSARQAKDYMKENPFAIGIVGSPIIVLPEGRDLAERALNNRVPFSKDDFIKYGYGSYSNLTNELLPYDHLRQCDLAARALSYIKGCPEIGLDWPIKKRDGAIINIRKFLQKVELKDIHYKCPWRFGVVY